MQPHRPIQPGRPTHPLSYPEYPFQCICADYFQHGGHHYVVIVDRYSNWPIVERAHDGAQGLVDCLRRTFITFGIPVELSSDGGPEFTSSLTQDFFRRWGIRHRLSSVAFPHSNCRAELGVKTVKRLLMTNTAPDGNVNLDPFQRAILQYRNTPDADTKLSPAMCIFGRPIRDFIPIPPGQYRPHPDWSDSLLLREQALRKRHMLMSERLSEHTRRLPPLRTGDHVHVQNQMGPQPRRWDRTGTVIEVRQFDQYAIKIDGSGRVTLRNRRFLRKFTPVAPVSPGLPALSNIAPPTPDAPVMTDNPDASPAAPCSTRAPTAPSDGDRNPATTDTHVPDDVDHHPQPGGPSIGDGLGPAPVPDTLPTPRRSERTRRKPLWHDDYHM